MAPSDHDNLTVYLSPAENYQFEFDTEFGQIANTSQIGDPLLTILTLTAQTVITILMKTDPQMTLDFKARLSGL